MSVNPLDIAYRGKVAAHGDFHAHAATGGTSDGLTTLAEWSDFMDSAGTDFVAIVDHRQVRHTYLPEWDDRRFICGTEPGTYMEGCRAAEDSGLHYNMIFPRQGLLEEVLNLFPEFGYTRMGVAPADDDHEGHFEYPHFTYDRMRQLVQAVRERGGIFTHNHPTTIMRSDDIMDYYFCDFHNIEIIYYYPEYEHSERAYRLWKSLIEAGCRVYAIAGGDEHGRPNTGGLSTVYVAEKTASAYVEAAHRGDMTCGAIGIRMYVTDGTDMVVTGDTWTGGDARLYIRVGDAYPGNFDGEAEYTLDIYKDSIIVYTEAFTGLKPVDVELPFDVDCLFYRAEVTHAGTGVRVAIGNPIFSSGAHTSPDILQED